MSTNAIAALFYQIPEGVLVITGGLGLLGITLPRKRILLLGLVFGLSIPLMRNVGIPLGLHVPILWMVASLVVRLGMSVTLSTAIASATLAFFLLSLGEQLLVYPLMTVYGASFQTVYQNPWQLVQWGWLSASFLLLATIASQFGFVLIPAPSGDTQVSPDD